MKMAVSKSWMCAAVLLMASLEFVAVAAERRYNFLAEPQKEERANNSYGLPSKAEEEDWQCSESHPNCKGYTPYPGCCRQRKHISNHASLQDSNSSASARSNENVIMIFVLTFASVVAYLIVDRFGNTLHVL